MLTGAELTTILYSAVDNVGPTNAEIYYRVSDSDPWVPLDLQEPPNGVFSFYVPNTPTTEARVRVRVRDGAGNYGEDMSDAVFTILQTPGGFVGTTLRDFHLPGSQPLFGMQFQPTSFCEICHASYDETVEPGFNFNGSMMAHSARDPVFFAALAVANQDAPASGDYCLRCHTPGGWISGRCNPTDGTLLQPSDRDGVSCDVCHRMVDPIYVEGVSPMEDVAVLQALDPDDVPTTYAEGQYVLDPAFTWRGPFSDPEAQHPFLVSDFHTRSDMCGTCHDVSNPAYIRVGTDDYAPGPLDAPEDSISVFVLMPQERTYSEWLNSDFNTPTGVFAPEFAGAKPDGMVSTCQDCHMRDVVGKGCNFKFAPERSDLPLHDFSGANTWVLDQIDDLYPGETDPAAISAGVERARYMLQNAALLDVDLSTVADSFQATVTVTNRSGHKLPTGFSEGRRMWINLKALDDQGTVIYESGAYDFETGVLTHDEDAKIYEVEFGISTDLAASSGHPAGGSFHNAVNDTAYSDNRIPPLGFTNAAYEAFGGKPFDDDPGPGDLYPDGQNWDETAYALPAETFQVQTTLYFQTLTKEYVDFLKDENVTNTAGTELHALWTNNGKAAPDVMRADTTFTVPSAAPELPVATAVHMRLGPNPFPETVAILLDLPRPTDVQFEVFDLQGRKIRDVPVGTMSPGPHSVFWDGRTESGRDAGSGVFWIRVRAGEVTHVRRAVRIR